MPLTAQDIPGLRLRIQKGLSTPAKEADRYEVGVETIRRAVRGETFRHIKDFLPEPHVSGESAPMATKNPVPLPPDEGAEASLHRVQEGDPTGDALNSAVDEFLRTRGEKK